MRENVIPWRLIKSWYWYFRSSREILGHIQSLFNQDKVAEPIDFIGFFATFLSLKDVVWEYLSGKGNKNHFVHT